MKNRDEILGILLPDGSDIYLLPNVCIAEIFTLDENLLTPYQGDQEPGKAIGELTWRQTSIQLLHMGSLLAGFNGVFNFKQIQKPRIAVINPITRPDLPLYGLLTTSTPKLTRVKSSDFNNQATISHDLPVVYTGQLGKETIKIPNLTYLEQKVRAIRR